MRKWVSLLAGTAVGALIGMTVSYLFGAASGTTYDERYRSRWDQALEDGRQAATAHELVLRQQLEAAKQSKAALPKQGESG